MRGRPERSKVPAAMKMKHLSKTFALLLAVALAAPRAAEAHGDSGLVIFDIFLNLIALGVEVATLEEMQHPPPAPAESYQQQRADEEWPPPRWAPARVKRPRHDARQGLLTSFGLGG